MLFHKDTILISKFTDPYINTALGKLLVSKYKSSGSNKNTLFLSSSHHGVFIGNNQNCWTECNMSLMKKDNIPLIRRDTGGGACYVDRGNRLFSFINQLQGNSIKSKYSIIVNALQNIGINAIQHGKNDIIVDNKKISGSAFTLSDNIFKHHGTILHSVDINNLSRYLNPNNKKLESKGIKSVHARIINLVDIKPDLTMGHIDSALIHSFNDHNKAVADIIIIDELWTNDNMFKKILNHFKQHNYIYNNNPEFTNKLVHYFPSIGLFEFYFKCKNNMITNCHIYSDCLDTSLVSILEKLLINIPYHYESFEKINNNVISKDYQKIIEILNWLKNNL